MRISTPWLCRNGQPHLIKKYVQVTSELKLFVWLPVRPLPFMVPGFPELIRLTYACVVFLYLNLGRHWKPHCVRAKVVSFALEARNCSIQTHVYGLSQNFPIWPSSLSYNVRPTTEFPVSRSPEAVRDPRMRANSRRISTASKTLARPVNRWRPNYKRIHTSQPTKFNLYKEKAHHL